MSNALYALRAELRKMQHSKIVWITFIAFALAPVMGGVFVIILKNPELMAKAVMLSSKAKAVDFYPNWSSYLSLLSQAVGVGGVLIFGFVASWIFGREFSDGTSKDLLALPISRTAIINAKFATYFIWCTLLSLSNFVAGLVIGIALQLTGWQDAGAGSLNIYIVTTFLAVLIGTPVALFAIIGQGYLAPLGFVALTLVFAQIIAATGLGNYFPWSLPGLYSGAAGEYGNNLNWMSYAILLFISFLGYIGSIQWFKRSDQTR